MEYISPRLGFSRRNGLVVIRQSFQERLVKSIHVPSCVLITVTMAAYGGDGGVQNRTAPPSIASNQTPRPVPTATWPAPSAYPVTKATHTCNLGNIQQTLINRINQARANTRVCGGVVYDASAPVTWSEALFKAAAVHSTDMSLNNYFSHTGIDGRGPGDRLSAESYAWDAYAENIAAGQTTIDQVLRDWLASAGHCANIMKPGASEMGVACVINSASTYKMYWTMDFARPR